MDKSFYNTISLKGYALKEANANAAFQEVVIHAIFKDNPEAKLSPSMVFDIFNTALNKNVPITSIRRAITNLTKRDKVLEKTSEMRPGLYGQPEFLWRLAGKNVEQKEYMYKKDEKSAADFANSMLTVGMTQKKLFGD